MHRSVDNITTKSVRRNPKKELKPGGVGYRVEDYQGSGVTSAVDILKHEVREMGDKADLEVAADTLKVAASIRAVTVEIKRRFGQDTQGVWLASKKGVKTYEFAFDGKTRVGTATKISIPANAIKLIDLGEPDGDFFVFKNR